MSGRAQLPIFPLLLTLGTAFLALAGCRTTAVGPPVRIDRPAAPAIPLPPGPPSVTTYPVMLGIDVLEANAFRAIAGKRVGLLTHPAGVNRRGESTVDVLFRAPNVKLVALFAPEHGLRGDIKAGENFGDTTDPHTHLPVYSLYGVNRRPTKAQLKGLDALVIDLQDIGVRSYTFNVVMHYAMEACFENNVEVVVLDRPNPLGGLKVDGPLLDPALHSGVGAFPVPYVHGLTMGELACLAATEPGVLDLPAAVRAKGRLTIVPMRGWHRAMRWPETGLAFTATSPLVTTFDAVIGYAMVGLGCEFSGFTHGIGASYPFRGVSFKGVTAEKLSHDLAALKVPGLAFRVVALPEPAGPPKTGVYVDVTDWAAWHPTELSFELMRLACRYNPPNPFARLNATDARSFNIRVGSAAWWAALKRDGAKVPVGTFLADWRRQDETYQARTRKYWLYQ